MKLWLNYLLQVIFLTPVTMFAIYLDLENKWKTAVIVFIGSIAIAFVKEHYIRKHNDKN